MNRRIAVRAIILDDDKLFCVRLKKYAGKATDDGGDYWCLPGGGVDPGESLLPALSREIVEELGVEPAVGPLLYVQQFVHGDTEHLEFFFHVTNSADFHHVDLPSTTHGADEISEAAFIDPRVSIVMPEFLQNESVRDQVAAQRPAKFFSYLAP